MALLRRLLPAAALWPVLACGGGDGPSEPSLDPDLPATVEAIAGDGQTGRVGQALPAPIRVRVTNADGAGLDGVDIMFEVTEGDGSVSAALTVRGGAAASARVVAVTVQTDADGTAGVSWTLGTTAGAQRATARVSVPDGAPLSATFTATAGPGAAASLTAVSGDDQVAPVDSPAPDPLVVRVSDEFGNAVPLATIAWTTVSGGAVPTSPTSETVTGGVASVGLRLGPLPGPTTVAATLDALADSFELLGLATAIDPAGDDFATSTSAGRVPPDLVSLGAAADGPDLVVRLEFADMVASDDAGGARAMVGFVDFDVDQDVTTGAFPNVDTFRPGSGDTGMSIEYFISMRMAGTGVYHVIDQAFDTTGTVLPDFDGNVVVLRIPLMLLGGDDGDLDLAAIVGTPPEPTDLTPDDGHLTVDRSPDASAVARPGRPRRTTRAGGPARTGWVRN